MKNMIFCLVAVFFGLASASAFAAGGYSSIAFDKTTGQYGRYQGAYSESDAQSFALSACQSSGSPNCEVVGSSYDGYVVLAVGDGRHFGTGSVHDTQAGAEASSLAACSLVTANCRIALEAYAFD